MRILIKGGRIVNEGRTFYGSIVMDDDTITDIIEGKERPEVSAAQEVDASGCYVLPGIIDSHVHFREPGLTEKADMESESRAAAAGGVTTFFDMPNTLPTTTTLEALDEKYAIAAQKSHVNYAFYFGATNQNAPLLAKLDPHRIPAIKLFMGSSTGNMLVDGDEALDTFFRQATIPIVAHCEDSAIIQQNMECARQGHGDDPDVSLHPFIRSEEACLRSTQKAVALAQRHHARLHVAHISTADELELIPTASLQPTHDSHFPDITAEVCVGYLVFSALDYGRLGARIKVNPAIKSPVDQFMLREALNDGRITTIATDHAPHLLAQKQGGCVKAASGMPMIQFSLPTMLELVDQKVLTIERMVELMAHQPAQLFEVRKRGFLRKGYKADVTIVRPNTPWTVTADLIESKCKWSPLEGHRFTWRVEKTICNGHLIYNNGIVDSGYVAQPVEFR